MVEELRRKRLEDLLASIYERLVLNNYETTVDGKRVRPADAVHHRRRDVKKLNALSAQLYAMEER